MYDIRNPFRLNMIDGSTPASIPLSTVCVNTRGHRLLRRDFGVLLDGDVVVSLKSVHYVGGEVGAVSVLVSIYFTKRRIRRT